MVDVTLDVDADPMPLVVLQAETWELHVWAPLADLSRLSEIRSASWDERRSLQVGTCGDSPVFWVVADNGRATVLIGQDDETWDLALMIPLTAVDEIVALAVLITDVVDTAEGG
ncbi:hypothetical protein AGRA3207_003943 [Actinomadura graeca]|uniref:Uncharacterized protein n=1 Tax=Actinomadura graeca TaxID=2750812 RepID=A0ABX8QVM2_9ACTN|nr:hypothetical protein [Actinomadura graeca]QXJ22874.1 hypothetical protein AGRA3207_003943 [Actinomadura graeca]